MDISTIKVADSGPSARGHGKSKRQKVNTDAMVEDGLADITIDEAGVASLLAKIETLTREVEEGQSLCHSTAEDLPKDDTWEQLRYDLLDTSKQDRSTKSKIVVLGASGIGKSSVLNALLDEGNLLPSSATGDACTAVPIEIHYNNDTETDVKAEIQYVSEVEWRSVVEQAKAEVNNEEDDRSDRGHGAVQRVSLVYSMSELDISMTSVQNMIARNSSKKLLGKCTTLQARDRVDFYREFKQQIGSLKRPGFATWPMIDHVRLYIRHALLENGLVLVDIPGMFETNRARVENAANYLEKCSAVCIMTHAARSKSDTSQKTLLGRALQQMQFDQHLDNVLFVCTKSDEVNLRETRNEIEVPEEKRLRGLLRTAEQERDQLFDESNTLRVELKDQEEIADYRGKDMGRWKSAKSKAAADWDFFKCPKERLANGKLLKAETNDRVWDEDEVDQKIATFKQQKDTALSRCKQLRAQLATRDRRLQKMDANIEGINLKIKRAVFKVRNHLIKEKQAHQYLHAVQTYERNSARAAEGIVESADDEAMSVEGLDKVREKVFCVSALAYSRLSELKIYDIEEGGEALKDNGNSTEFLDDVEDTEIPALARRLKHVALTERYLNLRKVQLKLEIALGTLRSRLSPNVRVKDIDVEEAKKAKQGFAVCTSQFVRDFEKLSIIDPVVQKLYEEEYTVLLPQLKIRSIERANTKIEPYSKHPGEGRGTLDLWPAEYKAALHETRNGFYTTKRNFDDGSQFFVNFNDTVAVAIKDLTHSANRKVLVSSSGVVKPALVEVDQKLATVLDKLHSYFRLHAITAGVALSGINSVEDQHERRKQALRQAFLDTLRDIGKAHVAAARPLSEDIQGKWKPGYGRAYRLYGTGARKAMSQEIGEALTKDGVVEHALNMMSSRISARLSRILTKLASTLMNMARSIAAEYAGYMEHRNRRIESTGDPKLDMVRNQMIAMGYGGLKGPMVDVEEDVPAKVGAGTAELDQIMAEMAEVVDETGGIKVKAEAEHEEIADEVEDGGTRDEVEDGDGEIKAEASDEEMADEDTDEEAS